MVSKITVLILICVFKWMKCTEQKYWNINNTEQKNYFVLQLCTSEAFPRKKGMKFCEVLERSGQMNIPWSSSPRDVLIYFSLLESESLRGHLLVDLVLQGDTLKAERQLQRNMLNSLNTWYQCLTILLVQTIWIRRLFFSWLHFN